VGVEAIGVAIGGLERESDRGSLDLFSTVVVNN
jgi:hypothetical protein